MTNEERKALVERLRHPSEHESWLWRWPHEAADQIEADGKRIAELEAANERLREALEPFTFTNLGDDDVIFLQYPSIIVRCEATYGDIQLARTALNKEPSNG